MQSLKKYKLFTILIMSLIFFFVQPFAWAQKPTSLNSKSMIKKPVEKQLINGKTKKKPDAQVVNSSGQTIYQAKIGSVLFSRHIGTCTDGCSTGFKNIAAGTNTISVKVEPTSPWVVIGTLSGFEDNTHYAVNLVAGSRDSEGCAELYIRYNTTPTFNDDRTKAQIGKTCRIFPDDASNDLPETQVVNNSGVNIHEVKVGKTSFSRHIGSCSDGCSTGFKKVNYKNNMIKIKVKPGSAWVTVGTLKGFEYNKHYAVNLVVNRPGVLCAELFLHHNTSIPFNENHVKEYKSDICKRIITPLPLD